MELKGDTEIAASRLAVWTALNDPDVLARCIDGVERLEREGENRFAGTLAASVGPVKARFSGAVELTELDPPNRYVLVGEGKGGAAGFVKGSADVQLSDTADGGTMLSYVARSQVGGRLAQLGARLIEGTAKGYAERFFQRLKAEVEGPPTVVEALPPVEEAMVADPLPDVEPQAAGVPPAVWIGVMIVLTILLLAYLL